MIGTLLVTVRLHGAFGSASERERLGLVEEWVEPALERETDAHLEGIDIGEDTWTLMIVGRELDLAQELLASRLGEAGVPASDVEFTKHRRPT